MSRRRRIDGPVPGSRRPLARFQRGGPSRARAPGSGAWTPPRPTFASAASSPRCHCRTTLPEYKSIGRADLMPLGQPSQVGPKRSRLMRLKCAATSPSPGSRQRIDDRDRLHHLAAQFCARRTGLPSDIMCRRRPISAEVRTGMARIGLGASVSGSFVSRLPHLRSRLSQHEACDRTADTKRRGPCDCNSILRARRQSVTRLHRFVTVWTSHRALSMEKSRLREAARTSVNVTVGRRSREYLTERGSRGSSADATALHFASAFSRWLRAMS